MLEAMDTQYDVLIIGGGMVGAAIACALGQKGIRVAVFDRFQPRAFEPAQLPDLRVSALSYASEQLLKNLGAWAFMEQMRMCPYRRMAVWEKLHTVTGKEWDQRPNQTLFDAEDIGHEQLGYIVENRVTQLGLLSVLDGLDSVDLLCPATITEINLDNSEPELYLNDGSCFKGQLLIGADGANSNVRQSAGIGLDYREYEQHCFVITVEVKGGLQDITWQAFTKTGPEAFLPLPDIEGRSYASIVWYNLPENVRRLNRLPESELLKELQSTFPKELPPLVRVIEKGFFSLAKRHAFEYCRKGIVLVGDAAHTINPLAGQGVNLGFQDVAWLSEVLIAAYEKGESLGDLEVLKRYEKARRTDNQLMMNAMDGFYHVFSNDSKPLKLVRNIALGIAGKSTPALKEVMKYAMGISGRQASLTLPRSRL